MKIFLVEDSPVVRERLVAVVSELPGVEIVGHAEDARQAVESMERLQPDVVTLDIRLSGGSGIEVLREVKRMPHAPVVIMLTNLVSSECRAACWEAGAEFFIDKSFGYEQLAGILEALAVEAAIPPAQVPVAPTRMERRR